MLRSNVAEPRNDIVEKGLAIRSDWSGTVVSFRAPRALRDPAPPARSPWRGFGGAGAAATERRISMTKSAKKRPAMSGPAPVVAAKAAQHTADPKAKKPDTRSKQSRVIAMLQSPPGATIAAMMTATGWQQHSVRGFLAGVVRKRLKLKLASKTVDGNRVYQIASGDSGKTASAVSKRRPA